MKRTWVEKTWSNRYGWSIAAGVLLGAAFPNLNLAAMAWVAPGCLLFSALGKRGGEAFRIGFVGGMAFSLVAFSWLLFIPFLAGAIAGWIALSAYLATYWGVWVWLCWQTYPRNAEAEKIELMQNEVKSNDEIMTLKHQASLARNDKAMSVDIANPILGRAGRCFLEVPLIHRIGWAFSCAAIWVALEMIQARLFTGFPWNLLGVSQYRLLPLIQLSSWMGVYGISFLISWFSVALGGAVLSLLANPARAKGWLGDLLLPIVVLAIVFVMGFGQLSSLRPPHRTIRAVLIQPSIPQTLIFDTNQNAIRFSQLVGLSERALNETTNAQLLVWPEAAVPNMLRYDLTTYTAVTNLAVSHRVWVILGADDAVPRTGRAGGEFDYFNSSFLITPTGQIAAAYRKRRLVIFGEYIPLERWISWMKYLTPVGGSFTAGRHARPFVMPELRVKTSVLICFEDVFPQVARADMEGDTDFLLNITNNGWFGESSAQWQHAANAVFRAVENQISLVRCANNGLTCWVDACGGLHEEYFPNSRDVYSAGFKTVDIPVLPVGAHRKLTFYTRHGDWFGWGCVVVFGGLLMGECWKKFPACYR